MTGSVVTVDGRFAADGAATRGRSLTLSLWEEGRSGGTRNGVRSVSADRGHSSCASIDARHLSHKGRRKRVADQSPASPPIMSAAFSPIMMVEALVLPPMRVGMIEASTTRRPSEAVHCPGIDHRKRIVDAILQVCHGVIDRVRSRAPRWRGCRRRLHVRREQVLLLQRAQRRRIEQALCHLEAGHHGLDVALIAEEVRVDRRRGQRSRAGERCAADAFRPQQTDMAGEAGAPARLAAMVFHHCHAEMQLDVG